MDTPEIVPNNVTFRNLGIAPGILNVLDKLLYASPTPIQLQAIAPAIEGKDIIGIAQTGTGKTLAFGVPVIQRLLADEKTHALILVPTRELALQVDETIRKIGTSLGIRSALLIGGAPMYPQLQALRRDPRVVIATPGRLIDHMQQKTIGFKSVGMLVLDEADRMLDMGFMPQIKRILADIPAEHQTMLFSATLSSEILSIATKSMKLPLRIEVAPQGATADRVTQELFMVRRDEKLRLLEKILGDYRGSTLVFTKTKYAASQVSNKVISMGHTSAEIHSNRSLNQRKAALEAFKAGKCRVLVATDIVARGIDVKGVELVINYDLPTSSADYVHRIGRTARAGAEGHAISFVLPEQRMDIRDIERLIRKTIPLSPLPKLPPPSPESMMPARPPRVGYSVRPAGPRPAGAPHTQRSAGGSSSYSSSGPARPSRAPYGSGRPPQRRPGGGGGFRSGPPQKRFR